MSRRPRSLPVAVAAVALAACGPNAMSRVGSNQDPAGRAGLAHLAEHLLFQTAGDSQGTPLYDKFAALALTFNAFTGHDVTHYTSTALANRVDALL